jgi:carbonic anhydrase
MPDGAGAGGTDMADGEEYEEVVPVVSAEAALKLLTDGNWRFQGGMPMGLNQTVMRREEVASGQKPFAAVVGCSDSRVPPEIIFDVGLGDIFVVRAAGNVLDTAGLGSLEYAAGHLGVKLVVVLGHTDCGAVKAALSGQRQEGNLSWIMGALGPAMRDTAAGGDDLARCTLANIRQGVDRIRTSQPVLSRLCAEGSLTVRGALYDLRTGEVEFLPEEKLESF